jgi:hypothetical protein
LQTGPDPYEEDNMNKFSQIEAVAECVQHQKVLTWEADKDSVGPLDIINWRCEGLDAEYVQIAIEHGDETAQADIEREKAADRCVGSWTLYVYPL